MFNFYCFTTERISDFPLYCLSMVPFILKSKKFKSYLIGQRDQEQKGTGVQAPLANVAMRRG